ncbi:MAG TPA: calcium/sodium antiporter [Marinagarivorans sp.]
MPELLPAALAIIAGFVGLVWSADRFVGASAAIAKLAGLSPLIIGLTIVSLGTSAPEVMVSISAALRGAGDLAVGNALGSNLANIGMVLGATALIARLPIQKHLLTCELPVLLLVTAAAGITLYDAKLTLLEGIFLAGLLIPVLFFIVTSKTRSLTPSEVVAEEEIPDMSKGVAWLWFAIGLGVLIGSAELLVYGAETTALAFGVSPLIVGLTVIAIGTSLPELAASVMSALKGHHDIALGNIVGSNIFNLLAVMSVPGLIQTTTVEPLAFSRDYLSMAGLTVLLTLGMASAYWLKSDKSKAGIGRPFGVVLIALYGGYYVILYNTAL